MIEENNSKDNNCGYIFELFTPKICNSNSTKFSQATSTASKVTTSPTPPSSTSGKWNHLPSLDHLSSLDWNPFLQLVLHLD